MSLNETGAKQTTWWKKKDVKQTALIWVIVTPIIGYVATEVQVRSMGAPASEIMASTINLMRIFTWAAAPVAGLVFAMSATVLLSKSYYGDSPPPEAE
ncbi:MAG: cytochrome c oxidase subunit II, partial [Actinobacteria bacterium]|nr:cytochrome c oxidase subunit II [Actinomycetota bacterium]